MYKNKIVQRIEELRVIQRQYANANQQQSADYYAVSMCIGELIKVSSLIEKEIIINEEDIIETSTKIKESK